MNPVSKSFRPHITGAAAVLLTITLVSACAGGAEPAGPDRIRFTGAPGEVRLVTVAPGHFHAGLVQKYAYPQVDRVVHVYAPEGPELERHLAMIEGFNTRADDPTAWEEVVYRGDDFFERMLADRTGNVMVVAGNNARKIDYIRQAAAAGIHVFADKPMIIRPADFEVLRATLVQADADSVVINDIMTERHEITSILQRELARIPEVFGTLVGGTADDPGITKESVHFLSKIVAGSQLVRPAWFLDVGQQGEAITDVATHLVDLVLWQAFPDAPIDYRDPMNDLEVESARTWDTELTPAMFTRITTERAYPSFLLPHVRADSVLHVAANGAFTFRVRGVHAHVSVQWGYENPGGGDTHFSRIRGTKANLVIRQDRPQGFVPTLYVEPPAVASGTGAVASGTGAAASRSGAVASGSATAASRSGSAASGSAAAGSGTAASGTGARSFSTSDVARLKTAVDQALAGLSDRWPGLSTRTTEYGVEVVIPNEFREGHEEHFARVTEQYLADLVRGHLAAWERTNLLTKYWITTRAFSLAHLRN